MKTRANVRLRTPYSQNTPFGVFLCSIHYIRYTGGYITLVIHKVNLCHIRVTLYIVPKNSHSSRHLYHENGFISSFCCEANQKFPFLHVAIRRRGRGRSRKKWQGIFWICPREVSSAARGAIKLQCVRRSIVSPRARRVAGVLFKMSSSRVE